MPSKRNITKRQTMRFLWLMCLVTVAAHAKLSKVRDIEIRAMFMANGETEGDLDRVREGLEMNRMNAERRMKKELKRTGKLAKKSRRLASKNQKAVIEKSIQQINHALGVDQYLFEGDMAVLPSQLHSFIEPVIPRDEKDKSVDRIRRMAQNSDRSSYKWPLGKPINYRLHNFTEAQVQVIHKGIQWFHENTCLDFEENGEGPELTFVKGEGCWSFVGFLNRPSQAISIGEGCEKVSTVIHEIAHALGFIHEQSRGDRDKYISVDMENVKEDDKGNFEMKGISEYQQEYDFASVMHYKPYDFALNPDEPVLVSNDPLYQKTMHRGEVQLMDAVGINNHYQCFHKCEKDPGCLHGGRVNPRDCEKCICAAAYGGDRCELRSPGRGPQVENETCGKIVEPPRSEWNRFEVSVGGTDHRDDPYECFWIIAMDESITQHLELRVSNVNGELCTKDCFYQGGQIYLNDRPDYNPITFCCPEDIGDTVLSSNGTVVVRGYSLSRYALFTVEYRLV